MTDATPVTTPVERLLDELDVDLAGLPDGFAESFVDLCQYLLERFDGINACLGRIDALVESMRAEDDDMSKRIDGLAEQLR